MWRGGWQEYLLHLLLFVAPLGASDVFHTLYSWALPSVPRDFHPSINTPAYFLYFPRT